jgi:hypothetical protein
MAQYTIVSATAVPGKVKEAVAAVQDLAEHYNENHAGTVEVLRSMDGPDRYHWISRHESAAAAEEANAQWQEDRKYQEFASRSHELWQDSETHRYAIL